MNILTRKIPSRYLLFVLLFLLLLFLARAENADIVCNYTKAILFEVAGQPYRCLVR